MLNQLTIKNAKPVDKLYSLADKDGLFLRVKPTGVKQWYISKNVKTQRISKIIGTFPEMSLKEARDTLAQLVAQAQTQSAPKIKAQPKILKPPWRPLMEKCSNPVSYSANSV